MRKLSLLLAAVMVLSMLAACTPAPTPPVTTQAPPATTQAPPATTQAPTEPPVVTPVLDHRPILEGPKAEPPVCNLTVSAADLPQAQFAAEEVLAAARKYEVLDNWVVKIETIDQALGYEAYEIEVSGKTITVTGGDANGLMYGGLEVAEQIALSNGPQGVVASSGAPDILNRGIKFNAPLDMRTPSYTDAGDAAQLNIPNMWDMEFWKEYFDELARNRYNAFSLWNLNPFPSMVKVPEYPDIALDDVWRTTIPFDDTYNGTATNMVREEHWENYEVVKEITIDEKIQFWRDVMAYAKSRGIKFYIITWNIYTYGEQGKYGIDNNIENQTTIDYYRKSVKAMVETYPDLDGIGAAAGENMDWAPGKEALNENWLWSTYGQGINDALAEDPDREFTFVHRLHLTEFELIGDIWKDFKGTLDFSDKYSIAHMHVSTDPNFTDETFRLMPEDKRAWLEVRCDDMYYARWTDVDFLRDYLTGMPGQEKLRGFLFGADGYIIGRDYLASDPDEYGILHIDRHWLEYMLLGRMGYDLSITDEQVEKLVQEHFEGAVSADKASKLLEAMNHAGKIVPRMLKMIWMTGDFYHAEMNLTSVKSFKFLNIKYWTNNSSALEESGVMGISEYTDALAEGQTEFTSETPLQSAEVFENSAKAAMAIIDELLKDEPDTYGSYAEKEFYNMVKDQKMQATMGFYYAQKTRAAVEMGQYNNTGDTAHQEAAIGYLEKALEYWKQYAALFDTRYVPQQTGRLMLAPNPTAMIEDAEKDIDYVRKWRIKK